MIDRDLIASCVVIYNPDAEVLENVKTYFDKFGLNVIVDNSDKKTSVNERLSRLPNVRYLDMKGNRGIASALNRGLKYLYKNGFEYCLTMDQDSRFPSEDTDKIIGLVDKYSSDYSVIGLNFNHFPEHKTDRIVDAKCWLTSGNFVKLKDFAAVGGFDNRLFIDYVDFEFNRRLKKNGCNIGYLESYSLEHTIGSPIECRVLWKVFYSLNHSPFRYYYRYRNSVYLFIKDPAFYAYKFGKEIFSGIPKMLIYEKNRKEKLRMILTGLRDGVIGRLGKKAF